MWLPMDVGNGATSCSVGDGNGKLDVFIFLGNLTLFVVGLLCIFFVHVIIVSGVEATWLCKVRPCRLWGISECTISGYRFTVAGISILFVRIQSSSSERQGLQVERRTPLPTVTLSARSGVTWRNPHLRWLEMICTYAEVNDVLVSSSFVFVK